VITNRGRPNAAAVLRSLASESAEVRRAALMAATAVWNAEIAKKVTELAAHDADADVQMDARDVLGRAPKE